MANTDELSYSITWVLPGNAELVSLIPDDALASSVQGQWEQSANLVTFRQYGNAPEDVAIEYRLNEVQVQLSTVCDNGFTNSDECSPDTDNDGIPDYRDVCLPTTPNEDTTELLAATGDNAATGEETLAPLTASIAPRSSPTVANPDVLGCDDQSVIVLDDIVFESGKTYLSAKVRQVLDRAALAIARSEVSLFEVASHTDNAGGVQHNQQLSENRAEAIRHYLMLRGVGPNKLRARGYGETSPQHDNQLPEGRAANRRVELRRIE